jgi:hypothetical protein
MHHIIISVQSAMLLEAQQSPNPTVTFTPHGGVREDRLSTSLIRLVSYRVGDNRGVTAAESRVLVIDHCDTL